MTVIEPQDSFNGIKEKIFKQAEVFQKIRELENSHFISDTMEQEYCDLLAKYQSGFAEIELEIEHVMGELLDGRANTQGHSGRKTSSA